jgi:hypothetical protein
MTVTSDEATKVDLMTRRAPLAEQFESHPAQLHLALEIKAIDDRIAEITQSTRLAGETQVSGQRRAKKSV